MWGSQVWREMTPASWGRRIGRQSTVICTGIGTQICGEKACNASTSYLSIRSVAVRPALLRTNT